MRRKILLTGPPGCGKTTVVRKVADILRGAISGFYTEEVRDVTKQRTGFRVVTLDGKEGELARKIPGTGPRVGSYRVNVESFERVALPSLEIPEGGTLVIDEIGKMECCSKRFIRSVENALRSDIAVLATIPLHGGGAFIESVRRRPDMETVLVGRENREALPERLAAMLSYPGKGMGG